MSRSKREMLQFLACGVGLIAASLPALLTSARGGFRLFFWIVFALGVLVSIPAYFRLETIVSIERHPHPRFIPRPFGWIGAPIRTYWLPGVGTSGTITTTDYVKFFTDLGHLTVFDYPEKGFNEDDIVEYIIGDIRRHNPEFIVMVGVSLGGCLVIRVEDELERLHFDTANRIFNILISTPPDGSFVRFPVRWTETFHGPLLGWLYKWFIARPSFGMFWQRQHPEPNVSKAERRRHGRFRFRCNGQAQLEQVGAISRMRLRSPRMLPAPTLNYRTERKDTLVKEVTAALEVGRIFPNSGTPVEMPLDLHAGVKEYPRAYLAAIRTFLAAKFPASVKSPA